VDDNAEDRAQAFQRDALRASRIGSQVAGVVVAASVVLRGLPLWLLIPAISLSVGGAPLVAWIVGKRTVDGLPEAERSPAMAQLDATLKGSARLGSIRGRWLLSRVLVGTVLVVVGCLVVLSL
jgi:hypothetical protein